MSYSIVRRRPNASLLAEAVRTIGKRRFEIRQQVSCPLEDRKLHYLVETWFFFPQSLQINRWSYTATDYQQSLKNYIRLGVPIRPLESLLGGELPPPLRKLEAEEGGGEEIIELTLPEQFPDILEDCSRRLDDLLWQNTPETRERYEDSLKLFCIAFRVSLLARKNAVLAIEDGELVEAFLDVMERHKMVVENAGLLTVAALKHLDMEGKNVVSVLSGGNMDVITMASLVQHGLINRGRIFTFSVLLPDRPGELMRVSGLLARNSGNIIKLEHNQFVNINRQNGVELKVTLEAFGQDHKRQILDELRQNGYSVQEVMTADFYH